MTPDTRKVAKFYDFVAPAYGLWAEFTEAQARARARSLVESSGGEALLEVAIGTGKQFAALARSGRFRTCIGVELSAGMLRQAIRRVNPGSDGGVHLCRADARALPFPDGCFDVILNCYMLDLLAEGDIPIALREFSRVLQPGGRLVLLNMAVQAPLFNALWMWLFRLAPGLVGGCRPVQPSRWVNGCGWHVDAREEIRQNGFRTELLMARPQGQVIP